MPGIEFVGADAGGEAEDDVLDTGPRRPVPRWAWLVAAALALVVGIVAVTVSRSGDTPDAAPSGAPGPSDRPSAAPVPGPAVTALSSDGTSLFWVAGNRLYRAGPVGAASVSTTISPTGADFTELQLVADPAEHTVWVVSHGSSDDSGGAGNVEGFATDDLHRVTRASAQSLISGAAAFGGALFVIAAGRLLRTTAGASGFTPMARLDRTAHGLVAAGTSLLYVEGGNGSAIGAWSPSGERGTSILETVDNTLAVAGSTIFVLGGTPDRQSRLDTLSPISLKPTQEGLATGLDGALQLLASGRHSVIVLGVGRSGDELACVTTADEVDAPGPAKVQALAVSTSAAVTVLGTQVFQGAGDAVRPVTFTVGRCST